MSEALRLDSPDAIEFVFRMVLSFFAGGALIEIFSMNLGEDSRGA